MGLLRDFLTRLSFSFLILLVTENEGAGLGAGWRWSLVRALYTKESSRTLEKLEKERKRDYKRNGGPPKSISR